MTGNIPDTVVILRDQAEEFPPCQQLYSYQRWSLKVRYAKPKPGTKVGDRNVDKCKDNPVWRPQSWPDGEGLWPGD